MLVVLGWCIHPSSLDAASTAKSGKKPASKKTVKKSASSQHSKRRSAYRVRLSKLQPSSDRISEIQEALIREGYLKQEATGKWDSATRDAMRQYQQANGFDSTGLPESKALMKLGLGPHPLPDDANPSITGQASNYPPAKSDPPSQPNPQGQQNNPNYKP